MRNRVARSVLLNMSFRITQNHIGAFSASADFKVSATLSPA